MSNQDKTQTKISKVLQFPLTRMIVGSIVCMGGLFAANTLMKTLFPEGYVYKVIRWLLTTVAVLTTYAYLYRRYEQREITELSTSYLVKESAIGLLVAVLSTSFVVVCLFMLGFYKITAVHPIVNLFISLAVWIPLAAYEEIIFRGIVYRIMEENLGTILALAISALFFGFAHIMNEHVTATSIFSAVLGGILLGLLFSATRRLWMPIAFHAGWNWSLASWGAAVSGDDTFPVFFQAEINGPELITGGHLDQKTR